MTFTITGSATDLDLDVSKMYLTIEAKLGIVIDGVSARFMAAKGELRNGQLVNASTGGPWQIGAPQGTPLTLYGPGQLPPVHFNAPADGTSITLGQLIAQNLELPVGSNLSLARGVGIRSIDPVGGTQLRITYDDDHTQLISMPVSSGGGTTDVSEVNMRLQSLESAVQALQNEPDFVVGTAQLPASVTLAQWSPATTRPTNRSDLPVLWVNYTEKPAAFVENVDLLLKLVDGTTTPTQPTGDTTKPSTPTGLNATVTANSMTVTWAASTDNVGVARYDVSINNGTTWLNSGTDLEHIFSGLAASTQFTVLVRAADAAGNVSDPASITRTTSAAPAATRYSVFGATTPSTMAANTDGTPSIITANGFYLVGSAGAGWKCVGGRAYIPAGASVIGQTITISLWPSTGGLPNLANAPLRTGTAVVNAAGWVEVIWSEALVLNAGVPPVYIGSTFGNGYYTTGTVSQAGALQSIQTPELYLGEGNLPRSAYRIGTGATNQGAQGTTYYGHDILVEKP